MCYDLVMDAESRARRQSLRVIISEIIMVITVIITVIILAFLASGYWLNSDFKVERQGMLQIRSVPTGANVAVDGDAPWFQRTNTSKVLSSGAHEVVLSKEGYDSWQKTITISEGLLYRVNYPRLFLLERTPTEYYLAPNTTQALVSPNHNYLLLNDGTTNYTVLKLNSDEPEATVFELLELKSTKSPSRLFSQILDGTSPVVSWDKDNNLTVALGDRHYKINWRDSKFSAIMDADKPEDETDLPGEIFYFYDNKYSVVLDENVVTIYKKSQEPEIFFTAELQFAPDTLKIGAGGEFVFMESNAQVAVVDMELMTIVEWMLDSADYGWLDEGMLYAIKGGTLIVYDFDGQNRRELATSLTANLPVTITDNKWLYYFSDDIITRELIVQ